MSEPRPVYYGALHARGLNPTLEDLELDRQNWLTEEEKTKIHEVMVREKVRIEISLFFRPFVNVCGV